MLPSQGLGEENRYQSIPIGNARNERGDQVGVGNEVAKGRERPKRDLKLNILRTNNVGCLDETELKTV